MYAPTCMAGIEIKGVNIKSQEKNLPESRCEETEFSDKGYYMFYFFKKILQVWLRSKSKI